MRLLDKYRRFVGDEAGGKDIRRLTASIALALSFFGILILGVIGFAGWSANEAATQRERTLVENALNRAIARTLDEQKSVAWWDDSITHISKDAIDYDFVDANFGVFLTETYGHDEVFILNAGNAPIYAFRNGARQPAKVFEARRRTLDNVVALARGATQTGLRRRPDMFQENLRKYQTLGAAASAARWSGHLLSVDGRPAVVAAITILPNVDMSLSPKTPNLLVSVRFVDAAFISEIGRSLLLPDLAIGSRVGRSGAVVAQAFVTDDGITAGSLTWTTRQPGRILLVFILPMAALALLAAALLFRSIFGNLKRASSELTAREAHARHQSRHDALSGLPNRLHFVERLGSFLQQEATGGHKAIVAYLDIDRFKDINDTLGHPAGDQLIRQIAARLTAAKGDNDFLARFGGDELAILCAPANSDDMSLLGARIKEAFAAPFSLEEQKILVTASVGLAMAPDDGEDADQLMRNADIALYRAKAEGRDRAVAFSPEMAREVSVRRSTELDLRGALHTDQLALHYQPIISCGSHRVVGVEALLRWNHPVQGNISPAVFIPIAEDAGLMPVLGEWILTQAARDSVRWPELEIAVNLSPVQIRHLDLVQILARLIEKHTIDPRRFVLEITEGVLLDPSEHSLKTVAEIRSLGFKTSLDDFGTGYSSLSYLCHYQFDKIKIDRSFVSGRSDSDTARTIVQAIATLGRGLGMSVIAEGVETEADALLMMRLGCTEMQGFYFARPVPAPKVNAIILERNGQRTSETRAQQAVARFRNM